MGSAIGASITSFKHLSISSCRNWKTDIRGKCLGLRAQTLRVRIAKKSRQAPGTYPRIQFTKLAATHSLSLLNLSRVITTRSILRNPLAIATTSRGSGTANTLPLSMCISLNSAQRRAAPPRSRNLHVPQIHPNVPLDQMKTAQISF